MQELSIEGFRVFCQNREEAFTIRHEIFSAHSYYFETENPEPVILDIGAHIGLATLYFKKLYPHSHITAVEPHPTSFAILKKNSTENMLTSVNLHQAALVDDSVKRPKLTLHNDLSGTWLSTTGVVHNAWNGEQPTTEMLVPTLTLDSLISGPIDLLKMDIEGAEQKVLMAAQSGLKQVKEFFIEFHPHAGQNLEVLRVFLEENGFDLSYTQDGKEQELDKVNPRRLILMYGIRK